ncbi:MAG: cellobiose phosphorylase, partial [Candidatus Omnitrophota bacterium]
LYCGQTYLDNALRGGVPVNLGVKDAPLLYHAYSRKHGDLERDYNQFVVEPTFFSQGNGSYRDVNQNRRNDVWFNPEVRDTTLRTFLDLLQLDGFNPLVVKGVRFHAKRTAALAKVLNGFFGKKAAKKLAAFLARPFQPGELYGFLADEGRARPARFAELIAALAPYLVREESAEHGEGFWTDHWFYNLDLIDSYLAIYPEEGKDLLLKKRDFSFFDNDHCVAPRSEKYARRASGEVRQFQAVFRDKEKGRMISSRTHAASLVRTRFGKGEVYRTSLFVKLLCLFANKLASLDAAGTGVEMEADKPSWCDALNGLPGLLGSSLPETFELKRLAFFLIQALDEFGVDLAGHENLPQEVHGFIRSLGGCLTKHFSDPFLFWDAASGAKERFRFQTRYGLSGKETKMSFSDIKAFLEHGREKVEVGIERACNKSDKLYPTYFENKVARYRMERGKVKVSAFEQTPLPNFLEGPVHALKVEKDPARRKALLRAVRASGLYDAALGMYKVNASLEKASLEVGRTRIFAPGWLENESIFLHMEYKFLLEMLRGGMEEEFFQDFKKTLVPFQPAERYGRSVLENSSFIVSSSFPDVSLHGTGFVARLSGSTAEFLSMWLFMNIGKRPFSLGPDGKLSLRLEPHLPAFLFTTEDSVRPFAAKDGGEAQISVPKNSVAFLFLGKTLVVYHNPQRLDTFGRQRVSVKRISLRTSRGQTVEFRGDTIPSPYAGRVRDEFVPRIDIELG